jgi:hypothetical protein
MKIQSIRNLLMVFGCYWLSIWIALPIAFINGKITYGITYTGIFGAILMHTVAAIPLATVSFGAGMLIRNLLEDSSPKYWILLLALLYASKYFMGVHWAIQPALSDRVLQLPQSIIPAITCYIGSRMPLRITNNPS